MANAETRETGRRAPTRFITARHATDLPKGLPALIRKLERLMRRATGRALLGTFIGNAPGFLLPFAITARMHVGHLTDAYAFALGLAILASGLFTGVLQTNVLPIAQRMKDLGRAAFLGRLRGMSIQVVGISTLLYAAIGVASLAYIDSNTHWTHQQHELLLGATIIFSVFVCASAINAILSAGLNALDSFLSPAATQALRSIMPLAAIGFVSRDTGGLLTIALLLAGGELIRTFVLAYQLRKSTLSLAPGPAPDDYRAELPLWRVAAPAALSLLISGASPLIDRVVAAPLHAGSVTYIDLGEKVFQVPLTIVSTSLVLVAATYWAAIRTTDIPRLTEHVRRTLVRGGAVCVALVAGMIGALGAVSIIAGGTLAGGSTSKLVSIVALLLVGLPAAFVITCGAWFLASTRATYLLPVLGVAYFLTNLGFDVVGAQLLGVRGIALSSTLCRCLHAVVYLIIMKRLLASHFHGLGLWRREPLHLQDSDRINLA
jgi:peptidoglycan biosynthesis protein MviN/MurJ (putative lipid II flippase)